VTHEVRCPGYRIDGLGGDAARGTSYQGKQSTHPA